MCNKYLHIIYYNYLHIIYYNYIQIKYILHMPLNSHIDFVAECKTGNNGKEYKILYYNKNGKPDQKGLFDHRMNRRAHISSFRG